MGRPVRGDIVSVAFPYSNLVGRKVRPAVVLQSIEHDDLVLCLITSQATPDPHAVPFSLNDFAGPPLRIGSQARPLVLITMHSSLVQKRVARLTNGAMKRIFAVIHAKLA